MRILLSILFCLPLLLTGCFGSDEPKVVELETDSALTSDAPEAVLLETARRLYGNGLYSVARESFESLQATYPLGPYAEYAQLKAADCFFMAREYENAAAAYQAFLKEHPTSDARDYVTFKTGLSHHLSSKGVGLDVNPLELGISFFRDTVRQFPDSPYAVSAAYYLEEAEDHIAEHQKEILEFYKKVGMDTAYEHRLEEFKQQYAMHLEGDDYLIPLVQTTDIVTESIVTPQVVKTVRLADESQETVRASLKLRKTTDSADPFERIQGKYRLQSVKCSGLGTETQKITLTFDDSSDSTEFLEDYAASNQELNPVDGLISLTIPDLDADIRNYSCVSKSDIEVTTAGAIEIMSDKTHTIMHLEHPNRLLLLSEKLS